MAAKRFPEEVLRTILEFVPKDRDARGRIRDCADIMPGATCRSSYVPRFTESGEQMTVILRWESSLGNNLVVWTVNNIWTDGDWPTNTFQFPRDSVTGHWIGPGLGPGRYMTKDGEGHPVPDLESLKQKSPQWIRKQEGAIEVWSKA